MATYSTTSPWYNTEFDNNNLLSYFEIRPVPAEDDDYLYEIEPQYTHRPDLLAYDLYGSSKLWWVFAQRNIDNIKDPIYDFVAGTKIYIPKPTNIKSYIGG